MGPCQRWGGGGCLYDAKCTYNPGIQKNTSIHKMCATCACRFLFLILYQHQWLTIKSQSILGAEPKLPTSAEKE